MAYDGAGQVFSLGMRVARLQADGSFLAAAGGMYVTDALVRITLGPEWDTPDAIERRNGAGKLCVVYQPPRTMKRLTISAFEICSPDPELEELLSGGTILTVSSTTRGYAFPAVGVDPIANGVSVEAWARAIINGAPAATNPLVRWVFPRLYLYRDEQSLQNDANGPTFTGWGIENSLWGNGPADDWTLGSARVAQYARMPGTDMPAVTNGAVAIPTQNP